MSPLRWAGAAVAPSFAWDRYVAAYYSKEDLQRDPEFVAAYVQHMSNIFGANAASVQHYLHPMAAAKWHAIV
ncbi:hypothetical protein T492DRAFT_858637, partial [Pavlovales sp. CCMP2436]